MTAKNRALSILFSTLMATSLFVGFVSLQDTAAAEPTLGTTSDFEDGTFQGWDNDTYQGGTIAVQSGTALSGTNSVEITDTSTSQSQGGNIHTEFGYTDFNLSALVQDNSSGTGDHRIQVYFGGDPTFETSSVGTGETYTQGAHEVHYGNLGGTDDPTLRLVAPDGTVLANKSVEPPQGTTIKVFAEVSGNTFTFRSEYTNGTALHSLSHTFTDAPSGQVGIGGTAGSGQTTNVYLDNVAFDGAVKEIAAPTEKPDPISNTGLLSYDGSTVTPKRDILNDTANRSVAVTAMDSDAGSSWSAGGAPSIWHDQSTGDYYMIVRQRTSENRGERYEIYRSANLSTWEIVVNESMTDDTESVEGATLRKYGGTWYVYFSHDGKADTASDWNSSVVTADTISGLQTKLDDPSTWTELDPSRHTKDPTVYEHDGSYYLLIDHNVPNDIALFSSSTPDFSSMTLLSYPSDELFEETDRTFMNRGAISYDPASGKFIYWSNVGRDGTTEDQKWYFGVSEDLESWSYAGMKDVPDHGGTTGQARYMDWSSLDNGDGVLTMEYDNDGDGVAESYIWDYRANKNGTELVTGKVTSSSGAPVSNATVVGYAATWPSKTVQESRDTLTDLADPTPQAWRDLPNDPDLLGTHWSPENVDNYVATNTLDALPDTRPWVDNPNLDDTATIDLPANQEIILSAWDADATGLGTNRCVPGVGSEYDCQMPGEHRSEATIVIERITASGDVTTSSTVELDQQSGGGYLDPDSFSYTTVDLSPGFYYIHEEGAPRGVPRKVGTTSSILDRYQQDVSGALTDSAQQLKNHMDSNDVVRVATSTDAQGRYSLGVPGNTKAVTIQAYHAPAITQLQGTDPASLTQQDILTEYNNALETAPADRTELEQQVVDSSVYFPTRTRTVDPPESGVDMTLYSLSSPPNANISGLQDQLDRLRDLIENGTFSDLPPALQQRLEETGAEELRATYSELVGLVRSYPPVKETYLELSDRDQIAEPSELSKAELRAEISAMNQALYQTDLTGEIDPPEIEETAETISVSWGVPGMDLSEANVSVIAHYANGTSSVVSEEYISKDTSLIGTDTVRVNEYPLGEADPASVQFELRIAGEDGLRGRKDVIKNPTFDGPLPRLDSVSLSSVAPGPNENVTVRVSPSEAGSFRKISNVSVYGPDGSAVGTSGISNGNKLSFTTNGKGIHQIRLQLETTGGETVTLPVRVKALQTDTSRPPTITARDSPIGLYALTSGEIDHARISHEGAGERTSIMAELIDGAGTPANVDVHLEELTLPGDTELTLTLTKGEDGSRLNQHVPVTIHHRQPGDDAILWRGGEPIAIDSDEGTRWGAAHTTGSSLVINTYTDEGGSVTIHKINNPTFWQSTYHWAMLQTSGLNIPLLMASPTDLAVGLHEDGLAASWPPVAAGGR